MPEDPFYTYRHETTFLRNVESFLDRWTGLPMSAGDFKYRVHTIHYRQDENGEMVADILLERKKVPGA